MELDREVDRPQDLLEPLPVELLIKVLRDQDLPVFTLAECRSVFEDKFLTLNVPHDIDGVSAVLDDKLECIMVGLVVDQSTKHFKLILGGVVVTDRRRSLIYDSTTRTWSWISHPFPTLLNWMEVEWHSGRCVVCNGCLYWLVWDPTVMIKALLIFDLREETWNVLAEEVMEDKPGALQILAYEGYVCLLAMDRTDVEFDRRSYDGNFLRHPMVRRMDGSLIRRTRDLWVMGDARTFRIHASGGSDVFFVFEEVSVDLQVAKYWAERDMMFFLPEPPFRGAPEFRLFGFLPHVIHDPWCVIIPAPGVNAEQEWITQQQRHLL
ncbi:hypothetical protein AXG93_2551s1010 [Marchantia polymorpha subsp. ruderalis]|uniref:F-box domain-containing protein n=1 Tax=Marchantia polymorpha subsp. ruderalis TaxID=1480154 RepID=A0A176VDJ2_MARPO|nr:hypothetical protein AXG93_2551s1010 [Marchantia polymorpha subsp. ruderalis]